MKRNAKMIVATCYLASMATGVGADVLRVDVGQDNGRRDVLTPRALNWIVKNGATASFDLDNGAKATFDAIGVGGELKGVLWKGGLDTGATLATDGVMVENGGTLRLTISGLAPGQHTLATFHNALDAKPLGRLRVSVNGEAKAGGVTPTHRAARDDEAGSAFWSFNTTRGQDVVVEIASVEPGGTAILNGFELDGSNPILRARGLSPADGDGHAVERPMLSWVAGANAKAHRVVLAEESPRFISPSSLVMPDTMRALPFLRRQPLILGSGDQTGTSFQVPDNLDHMKTYFWRVDEVNQDGSVTRGEVASFRVRHLAFPGAEGYGRFARGGRGGRVIEVTNLNDSGPGSLRAAIDEEGPRTVVFRVGGTIKIKDRMTVRNPQITIAGQTAPGDGIAVQGAAFGLGGTQDAILRYVRLRVGDESGKTWDGMGFGTSDHCIIDHCSIAWSIDEGVSGRGARNISFQRNIITEPLNMSIHDHYVGTGKGHGFAGSISGDIGSFHHNLLAHSAGRNWSLAGGLTQGGKFAGNLDIRNNVVYNWNHRTNDGGVRRLNLVNNFYIPGQATRVFHLLIAKMEMRLPDDVQQYYVAGNVMEGRPQYDADNWQNGGVTIDANDVAAMKVDKPFYPSFVTPHTAREAYESVLADVGANIPHYDVVDRRAVEDTRNRTATFKGSKTGLPGIPDSQTDVGGYPELKSGTAPADDDHDGMADWWERERGLNPANPEDRNGMGEGGYTNLEGYLNWIVENGSLTPKAAGAQAMSRSEQAELASLRARAEGIVTRLGLGDKAKQGRVNQMIADQYSALYAILGARGKAMRAFEDAAGDAKSYGGKSYEDVVIEAYAEAQPKLDALHTQYLANLSRELTPEQVVQVKDAMTDDALPSTYRNFTEMVPNLTDEQKTQIMAFLVEAREKAMDTVNAQQRRQWLAKYVGRTNNYIARQGYDFKRLSREWAERTGDTDGP